jgi:glycerol-3-phosphate acyltransferase PlsY
MITGIVIIVVAYLLGSIPTAYILGRTVKSIDIRERGSGNVGTANAFRVLGFSWAVIVLIVDVGKGICSIILTQMLAVPLPMVLLTGVAVVVGHNWSIFLRFRGGRGSGAALGVLIILLPLELLITLVAAGITFSITRRPLPTVVAMFAPLSPLAFLFGQPIAISLYALALPLLVATTGFVRARQWEITRSLKTNNSSVKKTNILVE